MYKKTTSCGEIGLILNEIYDKIIGYKTDGIFVEVGANDGKTGSFTYNLAKIGWTGIYIEPVPRIYNVCVNNHKDHNNIKVLNIGCGDKKTSTIIADGDTLSTMDFETYKLYKTTNWSHFYFNNGKQYNVPIEKLDTVLQEKNIDNNFDVLVLDVEGYEENVLQGFSINIFKPKIVVIEIPDQHQDFINNNKLMEKYKRIRKYFKNNYTLLVNDIVDNVYVRNDLYKNNQNYISFCSKIVEFPQYNCSNRTLK